MDVSFCVIHLSEIYRAIESVSGFSERWRSDIGVKLSSNILKFDLHKAQKTRVADRKLVASANLEASFFKLTYLIG